MKLATHIAYYNDVKDLKFFANSSADEIVEHYKNNYGAVYPVKNGDVYDVDEDFESGEIQLTTDGMYAVRIDLPANLNELNDDAFCQNYIDIYKIVELDEDDLDEDDDM